MTTYTCGPGCPCPASANVTMASPPAASGYLIRGSVLVWLGSNQWTWIPDPGEPRPVFNIPEYLHSVRTSPQATGFQNHPYEATTAQHTPTDFGGEHAAFASPAEVPPFQNVPPLEAQVYVNYQPEATARSSRDVVNECIRQLDMIVNDPEGSVPAEDSLASRVRHLGPISALCRGLKTLLLSNRDKEGAQRVDGTSSVSTRTIDSIPIASEPNWVALRQALKNVSEGSVGPSSADHPTAMAAQLPSWYLRQEHANLERYLASAQTRHVGWERSTSDSPSPAETSEDDSEM